MALAGLMCCVGAAKHLVKTFVKSSGSRYRVTRSLEELGRVPIKNASVVIEIAANHEGNTVSQQYSRLCHAPIVQAPGNAERSGRRVVQFRTRNGDVPAEAGSNQLAGGRVIQFGFGKDRKVGGGDVLASGDQDLAVAQFLQETALLSPVLLESISTR